MGSLIFSMITARLDLAYAISFLSRSIYHGESHWVGIRWLLRYIVGTLNSGLVYDKRSKTLTLKGYVNADFDCDKVVEKSTTAYFFTLGDNYIT